MMTTLGLTMIFGTGISHQIILLHAAANEGVRCQAQWINPVLASIAKKSLHLNTENPIKSVIMAEQQWMTWPPCV